MANSLLDFVISLVRDPDAAARYAANPAQAIANAHLTGVTSADVNNLIPMVSDSLSMANLGGADLERPQPIMATSGQAARPQPRSTRFHRIPLQALSTRTLRRAV